MVKGWHILRVQARGCHIHIFYDGTPVLDVCDDTSRARIGLWTKSDAITHFDDLRFQLLK